MALYAIGDVHGCRHTLEALLDRLGPGPDDTLVFVGDYVDRGPDSRGVVQRVRALQDSAQAPRVVALMGNHEAMMIGAARSGEAQATERWLKNGGETTLASWGLGPEDAARLPAEDLDWLASLPLHHRDGDWIFAHAGLNLRHPEPLEDPNGLLWTRNWLDEHVFRRRFPEARVVHGHTPTPRWVIEQRVREGRPGLSIDGGCVYDGQEGKEGWLVAFAPATGTLWFERKAEADR